MPLNLVILFGSVRSDRQGIKAAKFVQRQLEERGHTVTLVDPMEYKLPLLDRMYKEYAPGTAPEQLERLAALYRAADGFVIVTAEYNHSAPPALVNLLDHFLEEYFYRPSAIVSYSGSSFGGVRAASHLRDMLAELGMASIPSHFPIPKVYSAFDDAGVPADTAYLRRFDRFASELEWYARALRTARQEGLPRKAA
ncbi:NAD(P)H-dependent FMN reductase [Archangium gephyra]|uniref:Reductase n=1 Tax=Archangium gephyra TaxID=48 RepID=A0AAC8TFT0_9BACT|nr:NAD(P)H-dependent oxidoreductase [Archangium gephyra]AKJ02866.1 putative reductase [Archangium gephyra]REG24992.1 NAD(P)H-dependent FMN reductase [Archangium gephyra]